ncbi:16413_t:CDS:2, partial [Racocetra persica]
HSESLDSKLSDSSSTNNTPYQKVKNCISDDDNSSTDHSSDSFSDNNDIPSGEARQHWQYAHRQFCQYNINTIEYLPSVDPYGLLQRVHAAIFLSLDELWAILSDLALIVSIFDPQFKTFQ